MSYSDYYPAHMIMPGRADVSDGYRYNGANGQELQTEITGNNSHSTAEYWMYDSRLMRRWNVDPVVKENESPYATFGNNAIRFSDPNGDDIEISSKGKTYQYEEGSAYDEDGNEVVFEVNEKGEYIGGDKFLYDVVSSLNEIRRTKAGGTILEDLEASSLLYTIKVGNNNYDNGNRFEVDDKGNAMPKGWRFREYQGEVRKNGTRIEKLLKGIGKGSGGTIFWDNIQDDDFEQGIYAYGGSIMTTLAHEIVHAHDASNALLIRNRVSRYDPTRFSEINAVHVENLIRVSLGIGLRRSYMGTELTDYRGRSTYLLGNDFDNFDYNKYVTVKGYNLMSTNPDDF